MPKVLFFVLDYKDWHIPSIDPFTVPEISIEEGNADIGLKMQFKNISVLGLKDTKVVAVRYVKI